MGGTVQHFNMFFKGDRKIPLGVVRNEHLDVTSSWYLDGVKRTFLDMPRLVHIETLRATLNGGPCNLWSYPELVPRFRVLLNYDDLHRLEKYTYALTVEKAIAKARFCLSKTTSIPIENITAYFRDNPEAVNTTRIDYRPS